MPPRAVANSTSSGSADEERTTTGSALTPGVALIQRERFEATPLRHAQVQQHELWQGATNYRIAQARNQRITIGAVDHAILALELATGCTKQHDSVLIIFSVDEQGLWQSAWMITRFVTQANQDMRSIIALNCHDGSTA
jgi:hypothetical protein